MVGWNVRRGTDRVLASMLLSVIATYGVRVCIRMYMYVCTSAGTCVRVRACVCAQMYMYMYMYANMILETYMTLQLHATIPLIIYVIKLHHNN